VALVESGRPFRFFVWSMFTLTTNTEGVLKADLYSAFQYKDTFHTTARMANTVVKFVNRIDGSAVWFGSQAYIEGTLTNRWQVEERVCTFTLENRLGFWVAIKPGYYDVEFYFAKGHTYDAADLSEPIIVLTGAPISPEASSRCLRTRAFVKNAEYEDFIETPTASPDIDVPTIIIG
jgi:hypothetical protein